MRIDHEDYEVYSNNYISHGVKLDIEHSVHFKNDCDISDLIKKSAAEVEGLRDKSIDNEKAAYEKVMQAVSEWEKVALVTQRHSRALDYLNTPPVKHTSNKWVDSEYDYKERSNMVYLMQYRIDKRQTRNGTIKWDVKWTVHTQRVSSRGVFNFGRQEKTFSSEEAAEKYIQKRIAEYDYLFTEISPAIPDIDKYYFCVNGELLPGYTTVSMQKEMNEKKPSIKGQLNELKGQNDKKTKTEPEKKKSAPEIE